MQSLEFTAPRGHLLHEHWVHLAWPETGGLLLSNTQKQASKQERVTIQTCRHDLLIPLVALSAHVQLPARFGDLWHLVLRLAVPGALVAAAFVV